MYLYRICLTAHPARVYVYVTTRFNVYRLTCPVDRGNTLIKANW